MEEPKMKRFIKKLSALMIAAMLVIMSVSVPVQAKTITQPNRIITLYSGNARTYTSPLGSSVSANINIIGSTSKYSKVTNITTSNKSVVTVSSKTGTKSAGANNRRFIYVIAKKAVTSHPGSRNPVYTLFLMRNTQRKTQNFPLREKAAGLLLPIILKNNKTFKVTKKNSMLLLNAVNNKTGQSETAIVIFK